MNKLKIFNDKIDKFIANIIWRILIWSMEMAQKIYWFFEECGE